MDRPFASPYADRHKARSKNRKGTGQGMTGSDAITQHPTLQSLWAARLRASRRETALIDANGMAMTYGDIDRRAGRFAGLLHAAGARRGDRVTVRVEKSASVVALVLACARSGFVYQPLNTAYAPAELDYFVGDARPKVIVCDPTEQEDMAERGRRILGPGAPAGIGGGVEIFTLDAEGKGSLPDGAALYRDGALDQPIGPDDPVAILYTSGTTGQPKGAVLTHRNLASNALTLIEAWGFTDQDVLIHSLPIYHTHGLFVATFCGLFGGGRLIFLPKFDADAVIEKFADATAFMGVPTHYTRLVGHPNLTRDVCSGMRLFVSGSAPLREETFNAFRDRSGHTILERYGMTEINMACSNPLEGDRRAGTVGPALPGIEVRVTDPDTDRSLPPGEVGLLQVKGPNVCKEYWGKPEKTAAAFTEDGYFRTGDMAKQGEDGYVTIVGRDSDMIISGGLNVYPKEVEQVLDSIDGIEESAVFGVPHPDFGEAVVAVVVPAAGIGAGLPNPDSIGTVLDAQVARFKQPKHIAPIDEIPRNTMGKVQKSVLRERFRTLFKGG